MDFISINKVRIYKFTLKRNMCIWGSVQFSSVQSLSHVRLCNPMNRSMPGIPVHHQLLEFIQTHVHRVGDAIQPFHPLSSPSPPAPNPFQHQSLFQWVNSLHEVAKVLEFQLQHHFFQKKSQGWSPSEWTDWFSLQSKGLSRVFSTTQFKSINSSVLSFLHNPTLTSIHDLGKNHSLDKTDLCWQSNVSAFEYAI